MKEKSNRYKRHFSARVSGNSTSFFSFAENKKHKNKRPSCVKKRKRTKKGRFRSDLGVGNVSCMEVKILTANMYVNEVPYNWSQDMFNDRQLSVQAEK